MLGWMAVFMTFVGAVSFFAGSYLMIPELFGAGANPKPMAPQTRPATDSPGRSQ